MVILAFGQEEPTAREALLEALKNLKRPYVLHVYGNGNNLKKARKYAERHGLKVKFYGQRKREQILKKMAEAHLGVMASYNFDTQGMTLLEAEAMGLPVFFCDPAMEEIVPKESFVLADGPEAAAMQIELDNIQAAQIERMSKKMLTSRKEVAQAVQEKKMLAAYKAALEVHRQK